MLLAKKTKLNSVISIRERTITTEQLPLVGKVSAKFLRIEGVASSERQIATDVFSVF
jgi:hypothetical protein